MKHTGRNTAVIEDVWMSIAVTTALAAIIGYDLFSHFHNVVFAATTAVAAKEVVLMRKE